MHGKFKAFEVSDIFNHAQLGDTNLKKTDLTEDGELVVTSGKTKCGILGQTTREAKVFPKNTITVDMFGYVYYRDFPYKMVTHGRVMSLSSDVIKSREVGLYLVGALSYLSSVFGYNNMATWNKLKSQQMMLPVTPDGDPDFAYMTEYIRELEADRIRELEAYLKVTGLDDTTLSASEAQALTKKVCWKRFKIGDIFDIHPTKSYKLTNKKLMSEDGYIPVLTNTSTNNGIGGWSKLDPTEQPLMITYSDTTSGADTVFVQTKPFIGYSHVQGLYSKIKHDWTVQELLYVASTMKAAIGDGWSYATKLNRDIVSNLEMMLPVTPDNRIDFDYMQDYIRATEKQTIKDVVAYKDCVIEETKRVVNG